jgi:hypothetical protein
MKPHRSRFIASLLIVSLLLTGFARPAVAQSRPIVITFGQPNIWSLEQAHYLLNRMHRQNLDLQTAPLGTLDPNATNASRIDILKTLLSAGVSFDQAVGLNNELLKQDKVFNSDRRRQLLDNRSSLQAESTQLAREISALRIAKGNATTEAERAQIQASIDAKTEEKAAVDNQLTQTNDEAKGLTSATGEFQSATVPDMKPTPLTGDLDELIDKVALVNPSIAATLRLDNHIQLQYEIISKQLTLLRDEVGPGERLVFLELPQSINATQDRAEGKMAQTWWRIAGYTTVDKDKLLEAELARLLIEIQKLERLIKALDDEYEKTKGDTKQKNDDAKAPLERQVKELFHEKTSREADLENFKEADKAQDDAQKGLTDAKTLQRDAEAALEAAKKTSNKKKIQAAETQLKKAKQSVSLAEEKQELADASYDQLFKSLNRDPLALEDAIQQLDEDIEDTRRAIRKIDDKRTKTRIERTRLSQAFTSLSSKYEKLRVEKIRNQIRKQNNVADRLIQGGSANTTDIVAETIKVMASPLPAKTATANATPEPCEQSEGSTSRKYFNLENCFTTPKPELLKTNNKSEQGKSKSDVTAGPPKVQLRSVRTIDIIPRQNAINVQDTKQRLSRTGIFAAVSFLFGFAGKFSYERQRETAEQFLNQELFTSGFGKGEKDFGWSFYPFAGTKQLSSGVRTTYAVAIIPEDAETLILKARGCYFPRKKNQPLNYDDAADDRWNDKDDANDALCTQPEQAFVLPVPGGNGDGADFYVTEVRYTEFQQPGSRMIASIRGQNLPSQVAVFVEGVPLRQAVGLGQLNIESILDNDKVKDNCVRDLCGRFERIDENEIVISFEAGPNYEGTPRIEIIGPGKAIEINRLFLTINGVEDKRLDEEDRMFGSPPDPTLRRIADFKVTPPPLNSTKMTGVLTGSKFKLTDRIFINGSLATPVMTQPPGTPPPDLIKECRPDLCLLTFERQETDFLTVTITPADPEERAVSKTFINPTSLSIISSSVVSYTPKEGSNPDVLTVKLDGSGFKESLTVSIVKSEGRPPDRPQKIVPSPGQMFLKITNPEAVVHIEVVDPANNRIVSAVVVRPEPPPKKA